MPFSFRNDTAVGYYLEVGPIMFPEPFLVTTGTVVSARLYTSTVNSGRGGIKLLIMSDAVPLSPYNTKNFNNFKNAGMGEKTF